MDDDVLFNYLLGLLDQSLLEGLDLLEHLPSIWVGSLQLSPSVAIEWVLQLFGEGLDLESLGQELLLEVIDLLSQVWDLRGLGLHDSQLRLVVSDLELQKSDVLKSLLVLDFTSSESALEDLDFFVEEGELVISSDELGSEDISLVDDVLIILLQSLDLFLGFLDDVVQFLDLVELLSSEFLTFLVLLFPGLDLVFLLLDHVLVLGFEKDFGA